MNVRVLGFGIVKEIFGQNEIVVGLADVPTIHQLKKELEQRYPRLEQLSSYLVARNNVYAQDATLLAALDEIAIIPPVSGG